MTDKKGERLALFERLEPRTEFSGGRIVPSDVLTLEEAAHAASRHAGEEVTPGDFLRAAARGEIQLHAIVHRGARTRTPGVGPIPEGAIVWLPVAACRQLAAAGRASWRAFDGKAAGAWELEPDEPDFETVPDDCRVTGRDVRALADAFRVPAELAPNEAGAAGEPTLDAESSTQRRARLARRRDELKAQGVRDFTKRLAAEEGIGEVRVRQLLRASKPSARTPSAADPFGLTRKPIEPRRKR